MTVPPNPLTPLQSAAVCVIVSMVITFVESSALRPGGSLYFSAHPSASFPPPQGGFFVALPGSHRSREEEKTRSCFLRAAASLKKGAVAGAFRPWDAAGFLAPGGSGARVASILDRLSEIVDRDLEAATEGRQLVERQIARITHSPSHSL